MKKKNRKNAGARIKRMLRDMRFNIFAFLILIVLSVTGILVIRNTMLRNAQITGTSISRNYAAEEQSALTVYETLLSFGTATIDKRIGEGNTKEELLDWLNLYFNRIQLVLGDGLVDPYIMLDGKILAANSWEWDESYNVYDTEWYKKTVESDGSPVFTNVYTDAIYNKPVITISQKCKTADAILAFDIFPENLPFQFDASDFSYGNSFFLCDSAGTIIYRYDDLNGSDEEIQSYILGLIEKITAGQLDSYDSYIIDTDGNPRAIYYTEMDNGWFSIVTIPYYNIIGRLNLFILFFSLIIGLFLIALIIMAWRDVTFNARIERTNETVRVLGNSYYALYRVDYGAKTYEMIKGSDYMRSRIPQKGEYKDLLRVMGEVIEPAAYDDYVRSFSLENIRSLVSKRVRNFGGEFLRNFNGEYRWVSVSVLFDESLAPEEVVLSFREINQEMQWQLQERKLLEDALEMARKNEKAKQDFFSNMSHDMRTPLNAIIGLSELARQHAQEPDKVYQYLDKINSSSSQLLHLINDILDMSRMEQGMLMVNSQEFDLKKCIKDCLEAFRIQAEKENKIFSEDIHIKNSCVLGDPFRISQIVNNLVSNALKFSNDGDEISVTVEQMDEGDFSKYKLTIKDTGIGMSPEFLPHLFEPYVREMRFSSKQSSGTGLGMPITKSLVAQMNGEINVDSQLGKGTVFTIILPFQTISSEESLSKQEIPPNAQEAPVSLDGLHILLAEDNEVNMEITTEILSMNNMIVTQAWNGKEAVEKFQESQPFSFDAILMDMQMPEMDGCEAARCIRAMDRPDGKTVPIIAVTANAFAEDIAATEAAGMDSHVSKPIDFDFLYKTLERLIGGR